MNMAPNVVLEIMIININNQSLNVSNCSIEGEPAFWKLMFIIIRSSYLSLKLHVNLILFFDKELFLKLSFTKPGCQ